MLKKPPRKGISAFFATSRGRTATFTGICCGTVSIIAANFLPHTWLLGKYREVITCYRAGIERPVPEKVLQRLNKAFDILEVKPYERKIIKPFTVYGFDIYPAGSTKYRTGAILGIPANYSCESFGDFNKNEIVFKNEPIKWNSEGGRLLQEALVLNEEEQIFGMCRAIKELQTQKVLLNTIFPCVSILLVYSIGSYLNQSMDLFSRPLSVRMVMYIILGLFGLGLWSFMKDYNQVQYDTAIDKELCDIGPDMVQAGLGFYEKLLKKNIALRNLMGSDTYTAKGNENYLLRQKSLPITVRKAYFEERLKGLREQLQQNAEIQ